MSYRLGFPFILKDISDFSEKPSFDCLSEQSKQGVMLRLRATPKAAQTCPETIREGRLILRVKAPPVEGKANEAVLEWVARSFGVRISRVRLIRGERAREKDVLIEGISVVIAAQALELALNVCDPKRLSKKGIAHV